MISMNRKTISFQFLAIPEGVICLYIFMWLGGVVFSGLVSAGYWDWVEYINKSITSPNIRSHIFTTFTILTDVLPQFLIVLLVISWKIKFIDKIRFYSVLPFMIGIILFSGFYSYYHQEFSYILTYHPLSKDPTKAVLVNLLQWVMVYLASIMLFNLLTKNLINKKCGEKYLETSKTCPECDQLNKEYTINSWQPEKQRNLVVGLLLNPAGFYMSIPMLVTIAIFFVGLSGNPSQNWLLLFLLMLLLTLPWSIVITFIATIAVYSGEEWWAMPIFFICFFLYVIFAHINGSLLNKAFTNEEKNI